MPLEKGITLDAGVGTLSPVVQQNQDGVVEAFYPVIRSRIGPALLLLCCAACGGDYVLSTAMEPPVRTFQSSEVVGSWSIRAKTATTCWERGEVIELDVLFALPAANAAAVEGILWPLRIPLVGVVNLLEGSLTPAAQAAHAHLGAVLDGLFAEWQEGR